MRDVSWETSAGALVTMLNAASATQLFMADLYTITLIDGTVLRYTSNDRPVTIPDTPPRTYLMDPIIVRGTLSSKVGVEVDQLEVTISPNGTVGSSILGVAIVPFIAGGGLDGARITLERAFAASSVSAWAGTLMLFSGRVGSADCSRHSADLKVSSDLDLLNSMLPRNIYQASCLNTLYDGSCKINRASLTVAGIAGGSGTRSSVLTNLTAADDWYNLGVITFTSGLNNGQTRTVKNYVHASGRIEVIYPWLVAPQPGDTFTAYPGCDKTLDTCTAKFNNRLRFRGFKFIPIPDTVT